MKPFAIAYELLTRHRSAVVMMLDALEKAGIERVSCSSQQNMVAATLLFIDSDTPLPEVQDVIRPLVSASQPNILAIAINRLTVQMSWVLLIAGVGELISCSPVFDPAAAVLNRLRYWRHVSILFTNPTP